MGQLQALQVTNAAVNQQQQQQQQGEEGVEGSRALTAPPPGVLSGTGAAAPAIEESAGMSPSPPSGAPAAGSLLGPSSGSRATAVLPKAQQFIKQLLATGAEQQLACAAQVAIAGMELLCENSCWQAGLVQSSAKTSAISIRRAVALARKMLHKWRNQHQQLQTLAAGRGSAEQDADAEQSLLGSNSDREMFAVEEGVKFLAECHVQLLVQRGDLKELRELGLKLRRRFLVSPGVLGACVNWPWKCWRTLVHLNVL
jgi:hypothetical protein